MDIGPNPDVGSLWILSQQSQRHMTRYYDALKQIHDLADEWDYSDPQVFAANIMRIAHDAMDVYGDDR